ncbi:MAG TPA: plastocyanin/azurin family copper-binding protein [Solirubrobacteraceae bacterium]|jgi:plastocyanin|nr:plastocyanin/azurin family copper-binding protein [Solirubrobacteraceae bacterium]
MRRGPTAVMIACAALAFAAGCGSSSSSSSTASTATASTTSSTPTSGGLKANTTPKYASPSSSSPIQSGVVAIAYRNIAIDPDTLKVKVGSTIKWTNYDSVEHNVTSEGGVAKFASKNFGEGGSYEVKVTKPGIIHYECTIHPASMNGTIEVVK